MTKEAERAAVDRGPILVWGVGAIGGTIGAALVRARHAVVFVDIEKDHVAAIADPARGLVIEGPVDPHTGFVVDFFDLEKSFAGIMEALDHRCLNEVEGLANPTAENIAVWIWGRLKPGLSQMSVVRVYETADCWAEYDGR